jgi:uncharacterized surface protein with fasciclin (FAS1) repeats
MEAEIYSQLAANPELSIFVSAIDRVPGLREELSSSGLFTVMAPTNEAFVKYFGSHPEYSTMEDIPVKILDPLVKYHIMRWMFFQDQFLKSEFFKYETRANVSSVVPGTNKSIYHTTKMFQVYAPEYRSRSRMSAEDYAFKFGSDAKFNDETNMNVMGASVLEVDISAGNGACYVIDKVIEPPLNIAQELETNYPLYNKFIQKYFVTYVFDRNATVIQGNNGDIDGDGMLDSLFVRRYYFGDQLLQDIDNENPRTVNRGITTYNTFSAYIPSKEAFEEYYRNKLLANFNGIEDSIPKHTLALLYKSHLSSTLDWPARMDENRVVNLLGDNISVSKSDVVSARMASNGAFYELNKTLEPRVFTGVTGPAFFTPQYWYFAEMIFRAPNILTALGSDRTRFTIFAPTNEAFMEQNIQYFEVSPTGGPAGFYKLESNGDYSQISQTEINRVAGNHIVLFDDLSDSRNIPDGFYPAQNTNYVIVEDGNIFAAYRDSVVNIIDGDHHMTNGTFHGIDKLLFYPTNSIFNQINRSQKPNDDPLFIPVNPQYYKFKELVQEAGILATDFLDATDGSTITAAGVGKKFTLLAPSNEAIINAQLADLLPRTGTEKTEGQPAFTDAEKKKIADYLRNFFIPEQAIFTDGKTLGTFTTQGRDPAQSITKEVLFTIDVTLDGGIVTVTSNKSSESGKIQMREPAIQNVIASDGIIQVIDNAFTSLYSLY